MSDRVALITGGGGGMGSATCRALAAQGVRIAAADIDLDKAKHAIAPLSGQGHAAFHVDVTKEDSIVKMFADVEDALGPGAGVHRRRSRDDGRARHGSHHRRHDARALAGA